MLLTEISDCAAIHVKTYPAVGFWKYRINLRTQPGRGPNNSLPTYLPTDVPTFGDWDNLPWARKPTLSEITYPEECYNLPRPYYAAIHEFINI